MFMTLPTPEKIATNVWLQLLDRAAVYVTVLVMSVGVYQLQKLYDTVTNPNTGLVIKVSTVGQRQQEVVIPELGEIKKKVGRVTDDWFTNPRFGKYDADRLDDKHRLIMSKQDEKHLLMIRSIDSRLRQLEVSSSDHEHKMP